MLQTIWSTDSEPGQKKPSNNSLKQGSTGDFCGRPMFEQCGCYLVCWKEKLCKYPFITSDKFSLIGDISAHSKFYNLKGTLDYFGADMTIIRKGENKATPNPFEDIKPKDKQLFKEHAESRHEELCSMLYKLREKQLKHRGISFEDFKTKHLNKPVLNLNDLVSLGCLDGFDYLNDRMTVNADGVQEVSLLIPNKDDNFPTYFKKETGLEGLLSNRFRPL